MSSWPTIIGVMLDSLVQLLSSEFEVVAAVRDGISVVTSTERLGPDLLVLDIAMPGLSGIAAAARVRKNGSTAKVVFVTNARTIARSCGNRRRSGIVGFVVKDWLVADLMPAILTACSSGGRSSRRRSPLVDRIS